MIYIHVPFCHRKCTYCAFYSVVASACPQDYVDALCQEIRIRANYIPTHSPHTVYFGGGTPSMLSERQLDQIFETLGRVYDLSALEEVTMECNPEDLTDDYLRSLRRVSFVNRLSVGVQSFDDGLLHLLNRRHRAKDVTEGLQRIEQYGFQNVSVDLIYGIPGLSTASWVRTLEQVAVLPSCVKHLSCYALTQEPNTMFDRQVRMGRLTSAHEDEVVRQYETLLQWCSDTGWEQYEVSNFAKLGFRSRHNSRYWNRTPYLGVGAAAHSFDGTSRRWNVSDLDLYTASTLARHTEYEDEELTLCDAFNEYLMTALRVVDGIDKRLVPLPFADYLKEKIQQPIRLGLIEETPTHYRPTRRGLMQADGLTVELMMLPE